MNDPKPTRPRKLQPLDWKDIKPSAELEELMRRKQDESAKVITDAEERRRRGELND